MPDWYEEFEALFTNQVGKGEMAGTAYDTAWVASVPDPEHPDRARISRSTGMVENYISFPDGGWGARL